MNNLDWRVRTFLVGGIVGALFGLGAAYLFVSAADKQDEPPRVKPAETVGIGLALLAVLRQIASLPQPERKKLHR